MPTSPASDANVQGEVAAVIEAWRLALSARDPDRLRDLWDRDYDGLSYLPTERPAVLTAWDEISAYYDRMCTGGPIAQLSLTGLTVDPMGASDAFAFGYLTQVSVAGSTERRWQGRVQFHLHRVAGAWRLIHYEDSTDLSEAARFVVRLQAARRAEVAAAIRAGDGDLALALLEGLALPPPMSSAEAVAADRRR